MKVCPTCKEPRGENEFRRIIRSKTGADVTFPTRECVRCIATEARRFHRERKAKLRKVAR